MKIAMLGHKRIPSREGGVEIVVEELAVRMAALGNEVVCYNRRGKHVSGEEFTNKEQLDSYKGIRIKSVPTLDKKGLAAMTSSFFATVKATFSGCDVIHFHAEGPCAMMFIPKIFGKRCIATIHGLDWQRGKWGGFATKYIKFGEQMAVRCADEIIVLSENVKKYFKDTYNRDTIFIPNGVNRPQKVSAKEITEKFGVGENEYILFLGRIVPEKGISYLISAYKDVKTDKKLIIAGGASDTDSYYNEIKELAKGDDRVVFTGFVSGRTLEELYSNAYVYTLPSDLEGMPLSLLEAMSYSGCVLGSDIDEIAEVVEDKAVMFERSNVKELTQKLQYLCDSPELVNGYKAVSADFICNKYSWDDIAERTLKLYKR